MIEFYLFYILLCSLGVGYIRVCIYNYMLFVCLCIVDHPHMDYGHMDYLNSHQTQYRLTPKK